MTGFRAALTKVHRWTGLALVLFLVMVGTTGALLPFRDSIQEFLAPSAPAKLTPVVRPSPDARPLDILRLHGKAERLTGGTSDALPLNPAIGSGIRFSVQAKAGARPLGYDTIVLNPYTGREIARERSTDAEPEDPRFLAHVMPFLARLHSSLALGDVGVWILGIPALAWSIDCFVGFYLTLPAARPGWWRNWRGAWTVRWPIRRGFRLHFDLHRALGLWLWPVLFMFAWSSVNFNLHPVYGTVMKRFFVYGDREPLTLAKATSPVAAGWDEMLRGARHTADRLAVQKDFKILREESLSLNREDNSLTYYMLTSRDLRPGYIKSYLVLDANNGRLIQAHFPTGDYAGDTFDQWLSELHMGTQFGLAYRIFVSLTGVILVVVSITGVLIWFKKRSARKLRRRRGRGIDDAQQRTSGEPVEAE